MGTLVESIPGHRNYTPELKTPPSQVPMPFNGYTQEQYARDLIDKFIQRNISADRVWAQSFLPRAPLSHQSQRREYHRSAFRIPPHHHGGQKTIIPSTYAISAKQAGLDIIPWTLERSGPLADVRADEEYYYGFFAQGVSYDGQIYEVLDVLARDVGIKAIFSDWSSTVSYYANCFGLGYGGFQE